MNIKIVPLLAILEPYTIYYRCCAFPSKYKKTFSHKAVLIEITSTSDLKLTFLSLHSDNALLMCLM